MRETLTKGQQYRLSFTKPAYDRANHRYMPDNFRFVNPIITDVFYGGRCADSRHCSVCGRKGVNSRIFVRSSDMKELFVSDHCLRHPATRIWSPDVDVKTISAWYAAEDLELRKEAGDPPTALAEDYYL